MESLVNLTCEGNSYAALSGVLRGWSLGSLCNVRERIQKVSVLTVLINFLRGKSTWEQRHDYSQL